MDTRKEMPLWNTFYMSYMQPIDEMRVDLGSGCWTAKEVQEYMARKIHRGDFDFKNDGFRQEAYLEWSASTLNRSFYTTFYNAWLETPCVFGVYSYGDGETAFEAGLRCAETIRDDIVEVNEWKTVPRVRLAEFDEEDEAEPSILDMRLNLLAASTNKPRTFGSLSNTTKLLEWDDAVTQAFEYLLEIQKLPNISNADYREASHLLHRVSLSRRSLMLRIEREGIHVEPDLNGDAA